MELVAVVVGLAVVAAGPAEAQETQVAVEVVVPEVEVVALAALAAVVAQPEALAVAVVQPVRVGQRPPAVTHWP